MRWMGVGGWMDGGGGGDEDRGSVIINGVVFFYSLFSIMCHCEYIVGLIYFQLLYAEVICMLSLLYVHVHVKETVLLEFNTHYNSRIEYSYMLCAWVHVHVRYKASCFFMKMLSKRSYLCVQKCCLNTTTIAHLPHCQDFSAHSQHTASTQKLNFVPRDLKTESTSGTPDIPCSGYMKELQVLLGRGCACMCVCVQMVRFRIILEMYCSPVATKYKYF